MKSAHTRSHLGRHARGAAAAAGPAPAVAQQTDAPATAWRSPGADGHAGGPAAVALIECVAEWQVEGLIRAPADGQIIQRQVGLKRREHLNVAPVPLRARRAAHRAQAEERFLHLVRPAAGEVQEG
jgi:hypothetical protein